MTIVKEPQETQPTKSKVAEESKTAPLSKLPKLSVFQLVNLCIAFIGIQFAWSMQIGLSARVTEPLGATPIIFGLMWLAGPITGILVQPVVGVISDNTWTRFGRRRPFLLGGAILGSLSLLAFPNSAYLSTTFGNVTPLLSGMLIAASLLWIIDASVNISQGPYRALVPDVAPPEQHAIANSFLSFAIGVGAVIAFGAAPAINFLFGYQMSINQQFIMASIAFIIGVTWTCITIKENKKPESTTADTKKESPFDSLKNFFISAVIGLVGTGLIFTFGNFDLSKTESITTLLSWFVLILSVPMLTMALLSFSSKEVYKLCAVQFFSWLGIMCMFIYFNNYVVHNIFFVPDLSTATEAIKAQYEAVTLEATNVSSTAFAIFNLVCLLVSIPIGVLCSKLGKKNVHSIALAVMGLAFLGLAFMAQSQLSVLAFMGLAGIGWASVLALPFAMLTEHIKAGTEGSAMGKFNLFIAGPQILSSVAVGYLITTSPMMLATGEQTNHWEYAFIVGGISLIVAALITLTVKEKKLGLETTTAGGGH